MNKEVIVERNDIKKIIYFIISMFQQENTHRQGTSSKSDLIGGYIDRWINKLPEELIFSKGLLENKNYSVVNDYFVYGAQSDKNAPDILGLEIDGEIIKFTEFDEHTWKQVKGMPHIEIKTFRKNQKMVAVRETQLEDDNFYMFIETDLASDYLIHVFDEEMLDPEIRKKIVMDETFIKSNSKNIINQPPAVVCDQDQLLGSLKVINVIKGCDFRSRATKCEVGENVFYLKNIEEVTKVTKPLTVSLNFTDEFEYDDTIQMYKTTWQGKKTIAMYANNVKYLKILKKNKKSFYCQSDTDCSIYKYNLVAGKKYKVELEEFERSSGWTEYVALKNQFSDELDKADELVSIFDEIIVKDRTI